MQQSKDRAGFQCRHHKGDQWIRGESGSCEVVIKNMSSINDLPELVLTQVYCLSYVCDIKIRITRKLGYYELGS